MKASFSIWQRFLFARKGIYYAFQTEQSIRNHAVICFIEITLVTLLKAPLWWILLVVVASGAVISFELANTALENLIDHLHSEKHPAVKASKDCAAGAVLFMSLVSGGLCLGFIILKFTNLG